MLWNIYFADLNIPDHKDDIVLKGRRISHVEQADDVAIWSTSPEGLQLKLDCFFRWCQCNSMTISVKKTKWMLFGRFSGTVPVFTVDGVPIGLTDCYKYVGVLFKSTECYVLGGLYKVKAGKARNVTQATFGLEPLIGCIPAKDGIDLYMARVDPHLTFGYLEGIQHLFLRRLLVILFSETGLLPIRYCRITLALGFLHYVLGLPQAHLANAALENAFLLSNCGYANWINDLVNVLYHLPFPVACSTTDLRDPERIIKLTEDVLKSCEASVHSSLQTHVRTHFLRNRVEFNDQDHQQRSIPILTLRPYLTAITVPKHLHAFTCLIMSCHALSIERLRYAERYRPLIPRNWRLCCFCQTGIEDECHALLTCEGSSTLNYLCHRFLEDMFTRKPGFLRQNCMNLYVSEINYMGASFLDLAVPWALTKIAPNLRGFLCV
ncbi:hypothetical protein BT96DRAFT_954712 [Gymnopus androsaceus JB14]|uniref:Reverse transcriptase domain-containing protein n=1 Tax=Gymnopus androsaceus JB14 TaxID=1447944 RepID=A0A6A4IA76_9AGAR|nr:hypothetical protein BT96DRAFT_954712 [Gymnopus androsaceus JB14]